ncbi:hypothetical protein GOP47_0003627 [Adiantum capillus-veneris]|uniref:Acyl-[acyl-carrier-protein] hydrolase n=1 Tax=Adiantum capillus-veneris TaxID=13818 RepID=A0A9D4V620_ADICA|nr:hypothetical protein GOP47_0003627 [Adiantum capillus-veneris]
MGSSTSFPNLAPVVAPNALSRMGFNIMPSAGLTATPTFCITNGFRNVASHTRAEASPHPFPVQTCNSIVSSLASDTALAKPPHSEKQHHPAAKSASIANSSRLGVRNVDRQSYTEKVVIRCYEVGMNGTASPETMANLLQEVACNHAQSVGFSTDGLAITPLMRERRLIWVTTRMHIEVNEYPSWGDVVQIETWCQSEGRAGTRRDWLLTDVATGRVTGRATSTWVMMNQDTRRLSRVTDDVRDELSQYFPVRPRYAFPEENSSSLKKIPKLDDPAQHVVSGLMPRRSDLDMNQHVNNVTYIGWILESVPQEILDRCELHRITVDYRRECKHGDTVESLASLEKDVMCKELLSNGNGSATPITSSTDAISGEDSILSWNFFGLKLLSVR